MVIMTESLLDGVIAGAKPANNKGFCAIGTCLDRGRFPPRSILTGFIARWFPQQNQIKSVKLAGDKVFFHIIVLYTSVSLGVGSKPTDNIFAVHRSSEVPERAYVY
jgi:hypothetical protein